MDVRTVYVDDRFPSIEIWPIKTGVRIRNGKPGKPLELECGQYPELVAEAFFAGLAYASGK